MQADDKGQACVLKSDNRLSDEAGEHSSEGNRDGDISGHLPVCQSGGISSSNHVFTDGLVSSPEYFPEIGGFENDESNNRGNERIEVFAHNDRQNKVYPEDNDNEGDVPEKIYISAHWVVNPVDRGYSPETNQDAQRNTAG